MWACVSVGGLEICRALGGWDEDAGAALRAAGARPRLLSPTWPERASPSPPFCWGLKAHCPSGHLCRESGLGMLGKFSKFITLT